MCLQQITTQTQGLDMVCKVLEPDAPNLNKSIWRANIDPRSVSSEKKNEPEAWPALSARRGKVKESFRFLPFLPDVPPFSPIFPLFFPDFWQIFRCQGGTLPPVPLVATPLN